MVGRLDDFGRLLEGNALDGIELIEDGAEVFRLLRECLDEFLAADLQEAGVVLDVRRVGDLAADDAVFEYEHGELQAARVESGRETGHAGTDDDDVFLEDWFLHSIHPFSCPAPFARLSQ